MARTTAAKGLNGSGRIILASFCIIEPGMEEKIKRF